ncbi:hypothetical protein [Litoribaculum gwangyangense]|uniref:DUF4868 domain-containing protein n=1 Tax=Litoribaculum gwangyangense TaxID=1130722 RepID=A0ABP9CPF3_9FLAO
MEELINLINQYPGLSKSKVSLSDLDVAHRVFFNWKDKGIIDYEHQMSDEDIANKVTRKKVVLNAFEALWVLIIKELRSFNVGLSTIKELKTFLFTVPDFNFMKEMSKDDIMEIGRIAFDHEVNTFLNAFNIDIHGMVDFVQNSPDSTKIYYSPMGTLINAILLSGQSPSIFIFKKPSETKLSFEVFNPTLESLYYQQTDEDYKTEIIQGLVEHSVINIPIRPLFERFFENKSLLKYSKDFGLLSTNELKILKILRSRNFDKIIIYKNNDQQITIESTSSVEVLGHQATELNKILGLNDYERAEIFYRNNKNVILRKTKKTKIDLGNP